LKHFAIRSKSIRSGDRPFTCPGLGDRVHSALLAYLYSKGDPVTIHITDDKWSIAGGIKSDKKKKSWGEIVELFPVKMIIQPHQVENIPDTQWLNYLKEQYTDVTTYYYKDSLKMHPNDYEIGIDASELLKKLPEIKAEKADISLPDKFVTYQFDTTDPSRTFSPIVINKILMEYEGQGYKLVQLNSTQTLKQIAWALTNAKYHVGVDSGMMHMAHLYLPYERIHLYNNRFQSHHLIRAVKNGAPLNFYL
jgi:hypothetical protein